jgi:outer membrane protein
MAAAFATLWSASPAHADDRGYTIRLGLGAQVTPDYPGSDDIRVSPFPAFGIRRTGDPIKFGAPGDSPGLSLINVGGFEAGPAVNFAPSRKAKDVGLPFDKVKATLEAGGFVQFYLDPAIRIRAELRKGIGGHDGLNGSVGADFIIRDKDRYIFSIGPRARFSDKKYQRAYFGITPAESIASGLPAYRPDGGFQAIGINAGFLYQFNYHWGITSYARYDRLIDDPGKSPLVRRLGSRDQFSGGLALVYTFDIGKIF